MGSYNNVFGGPNIQPATVSYAIYGTLASPFSANIQLNWATSYVDNNFPVAQIMDVNPTGIGLVLTMPNATEVSVGQYSQINNISAFTLQVNTFSGSSLVSIAAGNSYTVYLSNNTTTGGTWGSVQNGAVPASPNASALAGLGIVALNNELNTNFPSTTLNTNYTAVAGDRAKLFVWTGGVGTLTLPVLSTVGSGYYIAVNNVGNGIITLTTSDSSTIDNLATFPLNPQQSAYFIATSVGGLTWNSLGFGTETFYNINALPPLSIAGGGTIALTSQQASRQIMQFTGALTQNALITYPAAPGQWYVFNNTTNSYSVTLQLASGGNVVTLPQGQKLIISSDGSNLYNAPTVAGASVFGDGSVGTPSIGFATDPSSGYYKVSSGVMGYSSLGSQTVTLNPSGLSISTGGSLQLYNAGGSFYSGLKSGNVSANVVWTLPLVDATSANQLLYSNGSKVLGFTTATYPLTTTANQLLYSSSTNVVAGLASANNGVLVTSGGGVPSISSTLPSAVTANITSVGALSSGSLAAGFTTVSVPLGGTGVSTTTAYGVLCGGTTTTGSFQNAGAGTINGVLSSNGGSALPTFQSRSAVKSDQTTGTSATQFVNPAVQQYHNSAGKAWVNWDSSSGSPVIGVSYNVTSLTNNGIGDVTVNFTTPFTSSNYAIGAMCLRGVISGTQCINVSTSTAPTSSSCRITTQEGGITQNVASNSVIFMGVQ